MIFCTKAMNKTQGQVLFFGFFFFLRGAAIFTAVLKLWILENCISDARLIHSVIMNQM